jgi:putative hemolysin
MARWFLDCRPLCGHPWRLGVATEAHEREEAYRLRYDVFCREMGYLDANNASGRDVDSFDEWCDHLILYDIEKARLIGTYRAIPGVKAKRRGGFYGAVEFDLRPLESIADQILQGSRTCIAADYRGGPAFHYLSFGMELLLREHNCRYFMGADSFSVDNPETLNLIYSYVRRYAMDPHWYVEPMPVSQVPGVHEVPITPEYERRLPPVIRMDLRLGFRACSPIAWDPEFRSYDILLIGQRDQLTPFYISLIDRIERKLSIQRDNSQLPGERENTSSNTQR